MPRPSMAAQRREEILDALERCILEESLESTSLERLAEKANMKRSILRHYIGNRDDIIIALSERYHAMHMMQWFQTSESLPTQYSIETLIEILFAKRDKQYIQKSIVADAIFAQAKRVDTVREHQKSIMSYSVQAISNEILKSFPNADEQTISLVARGIFSNYLNSESFLPLGLTDEIQELKQVSLLLLKLLD